MLREVGGPDRGLAIQRWLWASAAPLGLLAVLSWVVVGPTHAQTATPAEKKPEQLEQIDVTAPRRKPPARRAAPGTQPAPVPAPAEAPAVGEAKGANTTPLNSNVIAESVSRLGLTPRETPATVEVIDQTKIREQGYRTTSDAAKGFVETFVREMQRRMRSSARSTIPSARLASNDLFPLRE